MIGYYVHHQGAGHRHRATAVARRLRHEVTGLGSGPRPDGWPGAWIDLARDDDPPVTDPERADVTAGGRLHWAPLHHEGLRQRHRQILAWAAQARPSLVVVDVSVEVSLLVRLFGVPVVVGAMPGDRTDPVHALAHDLAEAILAPWPRGAHGDQGWPQRWRDKTWEVGGISLLHGGPAGAPGPGGAQARRSEGREVLVVWGSGGEDLDRDQLRAARAATPGWTWTVRGGGHPPAEDLVADLARADVVVCHAGQGSVADVATARRPAVVLAQTRPHGEQLATAAAVERLGLAATGYGWPAPEEWPGLLERALELGGEGWSAWGGDGAVEAAARLDALADHYAVSGALDPGGLVIDRLFGTPGPR